jgi:hypothetical protein
MAETLKAIEAQAKATERLIQLQQQLNTATGAQKTAIEENIAKIGKFIDKANTLQNTVKDNVDDFVELSSQISLSSRSSDGLVAALKMADRQMKSLSKVQVSITDESAAELKYVENITDVSRQILRAQQDVFSAADGTTEEQLAATENLKFHNDLFKSYLKDNEVLLTTNSHLNTITQDIAKNFARMSQEMQVTAGLTTEELEAYKELTAEADRMAARLKGIGAMITTALKKPMVLLGLGITAVGQGISKWGESVRSFGGYVDSAQISSFALGAVFKDAEQVTKSLSKEFGGLKDITFQTQLNTNLMATNMGISGEEAAGVVGNFARMNDGSAATAMDMAATTKSLGKAAGVPIDSLMKDVANSSQAFAEYGKDGGINIAKAAVAAAKLGVGMNSLTKVTDSLLDFETSINGELELGAMLGKQLNLDRARGLAYEGNIGGAVKETLQQLGGIEAFNKMDIFQKRKAAELLGLSVDEFQKMAANSDKLNDDGSVQLSRFDSMKETLTAIATGPMGSMVKGLGTGVIMAGQMGAGFKSLGIDLKGIASKIPGINKLMGGMGAPKAGGLTPNKIEAPSGGDLNKKGGLMESMGKIKMSEVLKGAAAMLVVAAAVFVFGKAVQEFMKVSWESVGMAVVSMLALVGAVALLGAIMSSGVGAVAILAGAAAMLVIAASVLVLGNALQAIGTGFQMMGAGIATLVPNLTAVGTAISSMVTFIPAIAALSLAMMGLAASLTAVGIAGVLALPGLLAVSAVGAVASGVGSILGIGGGEGGAGGDKADRTGELIEEIKGLRADLNAGKVSVHMDGQKVTSRISAIVDKGSKNSYGKN